MPKIEVPNFNPTLDVENIYDVPNRTWRKWHRQARYLFNMVYFHTADQARFGHPDMTPMPPEQWKTIRWNAAWLAADAAWHSVQ